MLVGNPERKRLLGRVRHTWEGSIKMYVEELWCEGVDWVQLIEGGIQW
jgi:hypothetical protein